MSRACVIVLDAVGAGELPDAAEFGDEGSDTLGNVARAVGGLDLPNLEAFGLGNVEPLEGCPPQPGAPAVAGRLVERSKGKDTTTGHWELMGIVTPQALPTYPHGFPFEVIDPFMHRTGRGVLGNKPASGTEIIEELGEEHQRTGKWIVYTSADSVFQIAAHVDTIPLDELYQGCEIAREILTGNHAVGRVIARPFEGEPGNYTRTPDRHDWSLKPRTAELPDARPRGREQGARRRQDPRHLRGRRHRRVAPDSVERRGHQPDRAAAQELDEGLVFTNLVETDMLWGHRNDPVNFHRCLQDFDRRLPDLLAALRPGDLLIITSDHGCDPTTPSTDHSREHALLLAYVEGKNAAGRIHEGEFADVGATVNAWLGGKAPRRGVPGRRDRREITSDPPRGADRAQARRREPDARPRSDELVLGHARGEIPDYQLSAFCMAVYFRGLSADETLALTNAFVAQRLDARPPRRARADGRRQALDRRRRRQDLARRRPDRRGLRRPVREDERAGSRAHRRHARQARVDPRVPRRALEGGVRRAGARRRARDHRADGRPRPRRQAALRAPRRDRDRGQHPADRGEHHVEEDRRRRRARSCSTSRSATAPS